MKILIVEDHQLTADSLKWHLESRYQVHCVSSCVAAQQQLEQDHFDLLLLDLTLPDGKGTALCENVVHNQGTPAIVISGHQDIHSKITALDAGADDYLTKPFTPLELLARIKAVLRRYKKETPASELSVGNLILKCNEQQLVYKDTHYQLTSTETKLLTHLLRYAGQLRDKELLIRELALEDSTNAYNTLEAHMRKLRRKLFLSRKDRLIETVYGQGYRLNAHYA